MTRTSLIAALLTVAMLAVSAPAALFADGMVVPAPEPAAPQIRDAFTVEYHLVTVDIADQHATTAVDQKIQNVSGGLAQAIYMFPVPRGANIAEFSMFIGEQEQQGEMMEADKAKEIYESYVRKMIDPALLEYVGQGVYRTSVFPFQKDESKRLRLQYKELLTRENGMVRYLYPLNTEKFSKYPLKQCRVEVNIKSEKPLRNIYSPTHEITIQRIDDTRAQVVFEVTEEKPSTDFELWYSEEEGETGANLLSYKAPGDPHGYFCYLVAPGGLRAEDAVGKDIVFVVDTSGSMLEDRKLVQVKEALQYCVTNLNEKDRFNIVAFSDWINAFGDKVVANSDESRTEATAFITRLRGEGGTNINGAFARAFESFDGADPDRERMIVFLTDGLPTIGERNEKEIAKNVRTANQNFGARVFNFGVGDTVNAVLLDWIAQQNHGLTEYIRKGQAIDTRVTAFYDKIRNPVLTDISFAVDGVRVENVQPALMPDIFAGQQLVITGKYIGEGEAKITFSGHIKGQAYERVDSVSFASSAEASDERAWIEHLWAGRRIGHLLDEIRLNGSSQEVIDEIVRISKRYGIPTPYTSFLVLEEDAPLPDPQAARDRAMEEGLGATNSGAGGGWARGVDDADSAQGFSRAERPMSGDGGEVRKFRDAHGNIVETTNVITIVRKTFYWRNGQWVDESIAKDADIDEEVQLLSDRYFELAAAHPHLNRYAARGPVTVQLGDQVIKITAAKRGDDSE